jgi:F-type H+-transporting ATPase subunit delta
MKNLRVARRYAAALMAAAESSRSIDETAKDLRTAAEMLQVSRDLRLMMASPVVPPAKKTAVVHALLAARVSAETMSFFDLLIHKKRERHLGEIIEEFEALRDEKYGIVNVDVTSAIEFTPSQRKDLADELERYTRKKVRVRIAVDKAIKGGLVVRIGDTVLDASVRRQLEILRERFLSGGPLTN